LSAQNLASIAISSPSQSSNTLTKQKKIKIEQLFGKVLGIERVLLISPTDSLQDIMLKVAEVPEQKLVFFEKKRNEL